MTDDSLKGCGHHSHVLAKVSDAEVLWVAIMAAMYFENHHERALFVLKKIGYLSQGLSVSRFNRRLHHLVDWLPGILTVLGSVFADNEVFVVDSLPVPVCKRVRARRCRSHWDIENGFHYPLDVILGEDASRLRVRPTTLAMATLRRLVFQLCRSLPHLPSLKLAREHFAHAPLTALALLEFGV